MNRVIALLLTLFAAVLLPHFSYAIDAPPPVCEQLKVSEPTFKVVIGAVGRKPLTFDGAFGTADRFEMRLNWISFVVLSADGTRQLAAWSAEHKPRCIEIVQ